MKKGYLSVPPYFVEKSQFTDEKQACRQDYSALSPLIENEANHYHQLRRRQQSKKSWLQQQWICLCYYLLLLSPRQKEKSTRKSLMQRSRTRGIKVLFTLFFCSLSVYFIHRFIQNHIHYGMHTSMILIVNGRTHQQHF